MLPLSRPTASTDRVAPRLDAIPLLATGTGENARAVVADGLQSTNRTRWSGKAATARPWAWLASLMACVQSQVASPLLAAGEEKNRAHVMEAMRAVRGPREEAHETESHTS